MRLIVGMTGATGAVFGVRLLENLARLPDVETHLVMSRWARSTVELETGLSARSVGELADCSYSPDDQGADLPAPDLERWPGMRAARVAWATAPRPCSSAGSRVSPTPDLGRARRMRPDLTVVPLVDADPGQVAGADDKGRSAAGRGRTGQAGLKPD
ncbi:flavoprotein [Kutzneria sp. 744]|uniref:flavoprotein n=1 Tax=Kutzneria sp. (strain 744) TaxID=345341 RepID=UPI0003EEBDB7|nr:flavoprotein [Kutzneria sp. 744]EWM19291.1 3-octaprenyl-4-hydroxybenzoate carboxy-lyase [Kutzneria sp. 744]